MHRGPEFLVPLGPAPFCPMIPSLAGPGSRTLFPGPVTLSSQAAARLARADTCRAQNNYSRKLRLTNSRAVTFLSIRGPGLVPRDLTFEVRQIKLRLRLNEICTGFDPSRAAFATVRVKDNPRSSSRPHETLCRRRGWRGCPCTAGRQDSRRLHAGRLERISRPQDGASRSFWWRQTVRPAAARRVPDDELGVI